MATARPSNTQLPNVLWVGGWVCGWPGGVGWVGGWLSGERPHEASDSDIVRALTLEECTAKAFFLSMSFTRMSDGTSLNDGILYVLGPRVKSWPGLTQGCSASPHVVSSIVHHPYPCRSKANQKPNTKQLSETAEKTNTRMQGSYCETSKPGAMSRGEGGSSKTGQWHCSSIDERLWYARHPRRKSSH